MSDSDRVATHFNSEAETPELDEYRPISGLVIAACVAGITSLLAIVHPLLWVIPVVAISLSVVAIVRVSASHSRYGGRRAAVVALCLATLVGSYAPARSISHDRAICREARSKAEQWISLIQQGRFQEAHQLSLNSDDRFRGPASLSSHYADVAPSSPLTSPASDPGAERVGPSPAQQLKEFVAAPAAAKLIEFGEQARIDYLRLVTMAIEYGDLKITQRFRASGVHAGQPESIEFLIRATRHEEGEFASWRVGELELVN